MAIQFFSDIKCGTIEATGGTIGDLTLNGSTISGITKLNDLVLNGSTIRNSIIKTKGGQYSTDAIPPYNNNYGMHLYNSDLVGVNALVFSDMQDSWKEGILFPKKDRKKWYEDESQADEFTWSDYNSLWANSTTLTWTGTYFKTGKIHFTDKNYLSENTSNKLIFKSINDNTVNETLATENWVHKNFNTYCSTKLSSPADSTGTVRSNGMITANNDYQTVQLHLDCYNKLGTGYLILEFYSLGGDIEDKSRYYYQTIKFKIDTTSKIMDVNGDCAIDCKLTHRSGNIMQFTFTDITDNWNGAKITAVYYTSVQNAITN